MLSLLSRTFTNNVRRIGGSMLLRLNSTAVVEQGDAGLVLSVADGGRSAATLPYFWLRDNCRCDVCFNSAVSQRLLMFYDIEPEVKAQKAEIKDDKLHLTWVDGHRSSYSLSWLWEHCDSKPVQTKTEQKPWNVAEIKNNPVEPVNADDLLNEEESLKVLLTNLLKHGFALVSGVKVDAESTQQVSERISPMLSTFYGTLWKLESDNSRPDAAYSDVAIGPHTDMTYAKHTPGLQIFHCLHHKGTGGRSLLVDGLHCVQELRKSDPDSFQLLAEKSVCHESVDKGSNDHLKVNAPILSLDPFTSELHQIRYNNYDRSPLEIRQGEDIIAFYKALNSLTTIIHDPSNVYWYSLKPGTMMIMDNFRVLHGRSAITGSRLIYGCYIGHDEWRSRSRSLRLIQ